MELILSNNKIINKAYVNKFTNYTYTNDIDTDCHITKNLLLYLLECKTSQKQISNFQTIYIEYKGFGHSCSIYKNCIYHSFSKYNYLKKQNLNISLSELYFDIKKYIELFFPKDYINLNKNINFYSKIKYYYTNIKEEDIIKNLYKL